jgi:DsbC/DsbD-like thiol-disulfide interchange protein
MNRITFYPVYFLAITFLFIGCTRTASKEPTPSVASTSASPMSSQSDGPPADVVQANSTAVELTPGGKAEAVVTIKIAAGYHINGNPASKYQIATVLSVSAIDGISVGEAVYPPGVAKKFSFSPDTIMVYESGIVIKQPLLANADAGKGNRSLTAKLRVQPCDDQVCYPPRTLPVTILVNVK